MHEARRCGGCQSTSSVRCEARRCWGFACGAVFCGQATGSGSTDRFASRAAAVEAEARPKTEASFYPTPPLSLEAPVVDAPTEVERRWFAARLFAEARAALRAGDCAGAIRLATASVGKGGRGHLLLARAYAADGSIDATLYWLERAAMEEGLDPDKIADDRAFERARRDARWGTVEAYLERCAAYWSERPRSEVSVLDHEPASARTRAVVGWLHPNGDAPTDNLERVCPETARRRGFVCVAMSGTTALGPATYRWSAEPNENAEHIASLLDAAAGRGVDVARPIVLMGLAEGAQVALETAARDPARFRGAIALSPRGLAWHLDELRPDARRARQRYVVAFGFDRFTTVGTSAVDVDLLRKLGARVTRHPAWFYGRDPLPPESRRPVAAVARGDGRGRERRGSPPLGGRPRAQNELWTARPPPRSKATGEVERPVRDEGAPVGQSA